jgi:hypothetical protein
MTLSRVLPSSLTSLRIGVPRSRRSSAVVSGFVSYTLARTGDGGVSVTVCRDKAGTDESIQVATSWIKENMSMTVNPPTISEGETILQLGA